MQPWGPVLATNLHATTQMNRSLSCSSQRSPEGFGRGLQRLSLPPPIVSVAFTTGRPWSKVCALGSVLTSSAHGSATTGGGLIIRGKVLSLPSLSPPLSAWCTASIPVESCIGCILEVLSPSLVPGKGIAKCDTHHAPFHRSSLLSVVTHGSLDSRAQFEH